MKIDDRNKKIFSFLLAFNTLVSFGFTANNYSITYASENLNIIKHGDIDFIEIPLKGTDIYVQKNLYDESAQNYSEDVLIQNIKKAKTLVKDGMGLEYNLSVPIYVVDENTNDFKNNSPATFIRKNGCIYIKNKYFGGSKLFNLVHEMVRAFIYSELEAHAKRMEEGDDNLEDRRKLRNDLYFIYNNRLYDVVRNKVYRL